VFPTLVENLLPTGLIGLVMAGLIAAVMGHTSGAINSCTTIATMDFYVPYKRWRAEQVRAAAPVGAAVAVEGGLGEPPVLSYSGPIAEEMNARKDEGASDAQAVRFGRLFGVAIIIVGILCAEVLILHSKKPIFIYLLDAYGYFTPGIATMFLLGILWKRTTVAGALAAGILTIPLSLALQWGWPSNWTPLAFQNRTGIVFWTCMATCALVSLCTRPKNEDELKGLIWTKDSLRLPQEDRHRYRGLRRPVLWWAIVTAAVLFFYIRYA
jgi:SSS family solute:Na+ symporter